LTAFALLQGWGLVGQGSKAQLIMIIAVISIFDEGCITSNRTSHNRQRVAAMRMGKVLGSGFWQQIV